ncbi:hypothetical protein CRE_09676 [Caenorhabditis remanei]|uniref:Uncharacterized protein n=1 Tax=Caenorhabditis remanei TaxID=31234 RepID=E3MWY6_CAERE|nr:hypothetical protein CRE_09676 [Caenorhabditis remanei]
MSRLFSRISNALDSKIIENLHLAISDLDSDGFDAEKCVPAFAAFLREFITWDLTKSPERSQNILICFMNYLKNPQILKEICVEILKTQKAVAVKVAVERMIEENWTLSHEECREVWKKIKDSKIDKNSENATENSKILRVSGTPNRFLRTLLLDSMGNSTKFGADFLNELAVVAPFHPLITAETSGTSFLTPHVFSDEYRFRLEIEEFIQFLHPSSPYQKEQARVMLHVFQGICERMMRIEALRSEDIEPMVDFWLAAIRIFDGFGIGMTDIQEAAKMIEKTSGRFEIQRRPLFLKRFLRKICEVKDSNCGMEPQIVATIITTFQRGAFSLRSSEFYEELGEFWTLCLKVKYDDVYYSTVFYSAVFALAQAQAVFKVKRELCRAVYREILQPMHRQIVDFKKLKEVEMNKAKSDEELMVLEEKNLGASYFSILTCTYKNAEERILEFIN